MQTLRAAALLLGLALGHSTLAMDIAVIVHPGSDMDSISKPELGAIFRRKLLVNARGRAWIPVNLPVGNPLRQSFSLAVHNKRPEALRDYWNAQYFNGISPPHVLASEEAVARFVAENRGAIAYVRNCMVNDRVRTLLTLPPDPDGPALTDCN